MSKILTRKEAAQRFGFEKVLEVERIEADFMGFTAGGERWGSSTEVPGGWLLVVYYQPEGLGDVHGDSSEARDRAKKEIEDADWTPAHFEYVED